MTTRLKKPILAERIQTTGHQTLQRRKTAVQSTSEPQLELPPQSKAVVSHVLSEKSQNPFAPLRAKSTAQVNAAIELVRGTHDDTVKARETVRAERMLTTKLSEALQNGTIAQDSGIELRFEIADIRRTRSELADSIERNNIARSQQGTVHITFGKKELASVEPVHIPFTQPSEHRALGSQEGLELLQAKLELEEVVLTRKIRRLNEDIKGVDRARKELRTYINGLDDADPVARPARPETIADALKIAENAASKLLQSGDSALDLHDLDPQIALQLLTN